MTFIHAKGEIEALIALLQEIKKNGKHVNNYLEKTDLLLKISYRKEEWERFVNFKKKYFDITNPVGELGWKKATTVYTKTTDRPVKPSYRKRLVAYPDQPKRPKTTDNINQIKKITSLLASKPGYSNLSFVFLRPADLYDQFRPGYVPCPIAGDVKFRHGKLNLSIMFRTNNALTVGYADLFYLRELQKEIFEKAKMQTSAQRLLDGELGSISIFFCRSFIEKRINQNQNGLILAQALIDELNNLSLNK